MVPASDLLPIKVTILVYFVQSEACSQYTYGKCEQVTRFELARLTWKDRMLPLHHTCITFYTRRCLKAIVLYYTTTVSLSSCCTHD